MADTPPPPLPRPRDADAHDAPTETAQVARRVTSDTLFGGAAEVQIDHRGVLYRLRQTSLGKLILTK